MIPGFGIASRVHGSWRPAGNRQLQFPSARPSPGPHAERPIRLHVSGGELQKPYFRWLGTPEKDKRHVIYDAAHDVMVNRTEVVKEVPSWLDQYLGPIAR